MAFLLGGWTDAANKRICRFLIHRYLGHLLKEKLSLEQLTVDLINGTGRIEHVNVDVDYANEALETAQVPFRLVDGYVGEICAAIPWQNLLSESCVMEVRRLEVTLTAVKRHSNGATGAEDDDGHTDEHLMSSMLDSMVGSLASSVELARSFLNEEEGLKTGTSTPGGSTDTGSATKAGTSLADEGLEAFAQVIDAVLCRMRLIFTDVVIRIERFQQHTPTSLAADHHGEIGTAVELRIDRMEFVDEQLESGQSATSTDQPITAQPASVYAIPDLNKILHLHGIRFYTDVFGRPDCTEFTSLDSAQACTSMYIRRQRQAKQKSKTGTPMGGSVDLSSSEFQSCYSNLTSPEDNDKISIPPALADDLDSLLVDVRTESDAPVSPLAESDEEKSTVIGDPIQFAQLIGERLLLRFRLKNSLQPPANTKIDIEMFLGCLTALLTPSQLHIITNVLAPLLDPPSTNKTSAFPTNNRHGKQMEMGDFTRIEHQLQNEMSGASNLWRTDLIQGNWSGEEQFYSTSKKPYKVPSKMDEDEFTSISVDSSNNSSDTTTSLHYGGQKTKVRSPQTKDGDESPSASKCTTTRCKARLHGLYVCMTHDDPFASTADLEASTALLNMWAQRFFKESTSISISARTDLSTIRDSCDAAVIWIN